jgi:glucose-1-phosphate thymidylyltransferase
MRVIIPMAGRGTRLRPHTLTVPKPLMPIAGKPIVQRLVEDIAKMCQEPIEEIAFIIGDFGKAVEDQLLEIAHQVGSKGRIFYQDKALGTAHAIYCAADSLMGRIVVAFADTLFRANFSLNLSPEQDGAIWVQAVKDPSAYGVVKLNAQNQITDFVEKPEAFVSNLAIIGIYYFKDGARLKKEIAHILENDIKDKGEYQLTTALENLRQAGQIFIPAQVEEWLDCGNKEAFVYANQRYLTYLTQGKAQGLIADSAQIENSTIAPQVFIGENVRISNSVIGNYVSIGSGSVIENAIIHNSIIQQKAQVSHLILENALIGNHTKVSGSPKDLSLGDFSTLAL